MKLKNILIPVDFSHSSDAALSFGSALAVSTNARLILLHVGEDSVGYLASYGSMAYTPEIQANLTKENRRELERIKPTIPGVEFEHQYLDGDPVREILRFSELEHVDLIVIGSHGRTGLTRLLLGSVAEAVVRGASCPVLTVKQPAKKANATESPKAGEADSEQQSLPQPRDRFSLH